MNTQDQPAAQPRRDSHTLTGGGFTLHDPTLAMCADILDDLENVRCANENRYRTLTDPSEHGFGLDNQHDDIKRLNNLVEQLKAAEHQAILHLQRSMKKHPLGPFVQAQKGVGLKQAARLIATIGDPYWNDRDDQPRTVRQLYRFCGMDVTDMGRAPAKQRGEKVGWNPEARKRLWLVAAKTIMFDGNYRGVYDQGRSKYEGAIHIVECKRCGPAGKPAQPGSPLSAGHQHARAIRLVAKQLLKDLWTEAKRIHETTPAPTAVALAIAATASGSNINAEEKLAAIFKPDTVTA